MTGRFFTGNTKLPVEILETRPSDVCADIFVQISYLQIFLQNMG